MFAFASGGGNPDGDGSSLLSNLVADSRNGLSLIESRDLQAGTLSPNDARAAKEYIASHADYSAYHLLFALRRGHKELYATIPGETRAEILCSALAHIKYLNDWGYLEPGESHDGEAADALIATRSASVDCMKALLNDWRSAPLFGTEEATLSSMYHYRRKDFAYRYLSLILGRQPAFDPNQQIRDGEIERLSDFLRSKE